MMVYLGKSSVAMMGDATGSGDTCARPRDPPSAISSLLKAVFMIKSLRKRMGKQNTQKNFYTL